jgi:hypothetical protein
MPICGNTIQASDILGSGGRANVFFQQLPIGGNDHVGGHGRHAELGRRGRKIGTIHLHGDEAALQGCRHVGSGIDLSLHFFARRTAFSPEVDQQELIRLSSHPLGRFKGRLPSNCLLSGRGVDQPGGDDSHTKQPVSCSHGFGSSRSSVDK